MWKFIITTIIIYFLARFIFRFVIPIVRVTRQAQSNINDLRSKMEHMQEQQQSTQRQSTRSTPPKTIDGEYIDYEEVK
jgi:uncharacterized protein YoxC